MAYKVMEIFRDLPRTNCGYCGKPGCLPFAAHVYLEGGPLSACTQLSPEKLREMEQRLAAERSSTESPGEEAAAQALAYLTDRMRRLDFKEAAERAGAEYAAGPPEELRLRLFNQSYRIGRDGISADAGIALTVPLQVLLLIYVTRAGGRAPIGEWAAFRDLPDAGSKPRQFEESAERIARAFSGRADALREKARELGGAAVDSASADLALVFPALPHVPLQLLFWDSDDDFEARASILLDRTVPDYLDPEAITFLGEAFAALLLGEDLAELVG